MVGVSVVVDVTYTSIETSTLRSASRRSTSSRIHSQLDDDFTIQTSLTTLVRGEVESRMAHRCEKANVIPVPPAISRTVSTDSS